MKVRLIQTGTPEYLQEIELRMKILRTPLGLTFSPEDLAKEQGDLHLGAFENETLVGCLVLTRLSDDTVKMRQVAVDTELQGRGVGRALVEASEAEAKARGYTLLELNARQTAVPFYLALGYQIVGEPFVEVTLPHRKMTKRLG